jgi:predicted small lipoprotein YifL
MEVVEDRFSVMLGFTAGCFVANCEQGSPSPMSRRVPLCVAIALTVLGLLSAAGCGVRGPLDAPPKQVSDAPPPKPGEPPPHKPSILDPLIR